MDTKLDTKTATYILKQFLLVDIQKVEGKPLGREESQPLFTKKKKETYKITILNIFIEFAFICKRISDISEDIYIYISQKYDDGVG